MPSSCAVVPNVVLGFPSIFIALFGVAYRDSAAVAEAGFLQGYSPLVAFVVVLQVRRRLNKFFAVDKVRT